MTKLNLTEETTGFPSALSISYTPQQNTQTVFGAETQTIVRRVIGEKAHG